MISEIFNFVKNAVKKVISTVKNIFKTKKTTKTISKTIEQEKSKLEQENKELEEQEEQEETKRKYFLVSSSVIDKEAYKKNRKRFDYIREVEFKLNEEEFKNIKDLELYIYDKYLNSNYKKYYIKDIQVSEYVE